jgi:SET domain-containing protein
VINVGQGKFGRGVIASQDLKAGMIIHNADVILVPTEQLKALEQTELYNYYYEYTKQFVAIALGFGSLFNHSTKPNAQYWVDTKNKRIRYELLRGVKAGEEIFINYNGEPNSRAKVWFE